MSNPLQAHHLSAREQESSVRPGAIVLGVMFTLCINGFDPISRYLIHSSSFTHSQMPFALLVGLLLLGYLYNPLVRGRFPNLALTRRDMAAVLAIGFLGTTVPTLAQRFVAVISAPDYYASPENEWPTYTLPNLQRWLFPSNVGDGVGMFYRGLVPGAPLPWEIWIGPLFWWFSLLIAIMLACFCLSVILRKQWSESERLAFPFVELSLMLVENPGPGRNLPQFFGLPLFWIGFAIPAIMLFWNTAGHFFPGLPTFAFLNIRTLLPIGRGFMPFFLQFDFYVICFAYFTTLEILLSMWFFHILGMLQAGISNRIGFGPRGYGSGVISQNNYGLLVFVLWSLWIARGHIHNVWRKAIGKGPEVDDSTELLSYRAATFGFILASLFIFFWLCKTQMNPGVAVAFMFFSLILYLGMAKIVALSGLVSLRGSGPTGPVKGLIGIWNMDDTTIAALNQMGTLYGNAKGFAMPGAANAARAGDHTASHRRRLGGGILIGGILSIFAFVITTLILGYYGPGAENFGDYSYTRGNRAFFNYTVSDIKGRPDAERQWWDLGFGTFGAAITLLLIFLNQRFPRWPLHPVGFTVSLQYPTRASFFSVFIAWLMKIIVLKVGGIELFNRSRVFIFGVLMGYTLGVLVSFILDIFFFMGQGHRMHTPPL